VILNPSCFVDLYRNFHFQSNEPLVEIFLNEIGATVSQQCQSEEVNRLCVSSTYRPLQCADAMIRRKTQESVVCVNLLITYNTPESNVKRREQHKNCSQTRRAASTMIFSRINQADESQNQPFPSQWNYLPSPSPVFIMVQQRQAPCYSQKMRSAPKSVN